MFVINDVHQKELDGVIQVIPMTYRVDFSNNAVDSSLE